MKDVLLGQPEIEISSNPVLMPPSSICRRWRTVATSRRRGLWGTAKFALSFLRSMRLVVTFVTAITASSV